jgi:hypothetical protein
MWEQIFRVASRIWGPTTRGNTKITEWKTHVSPKQFSMQILTLNNNHFTEKIKYTNTTKN